jgi:hypothetical protein
MTLGDALKRTRATLDWHSGCTLHWAMSSSLGAFSLSCCWWPDSVTSWEGWAPLSLTEHDWGEPSVSKLGSSLGDTLGAALGR